MGNEFEPVHQPRMGDIADTAYCSLLFLSRQKKQRTEHAYQNSDGIVCVGAELPGDGSGGVCHQNRHGKRKCAVANCYLWRSYDRRIVAEPYGLVAGVQAESGAYYFAD